MGAEKLASKSGSLYRIRVGDYRVVYAVVDDAQVVTIAYVGHRRDVETSKTAPPRIPVT